MNCPVCKHPNPHTELSYQRCESCNMLFQATVARLKKLDIANQSYIFVQPDQKFLVSRRGRYSLSNDGRMHSFFRDFHSLYLRRNSHLSTKAIWEKKGVVYPSKFKVEEAVFSIGPYCKEYHVKGLVQHFEGKGSKELIFIPRCNWNIVDLVNQGNKFKRVSKK